MTYGLHWFRRDLRTTGNPALLWNTHRNAGRVLGIFFFDPAFLSRADFSHGRFAFFLESLAALREELRALGGDLLVLDGGPGPGFPELVSALARSRIGKPACVSFNRDYEPFSRERDARITALLETGLGIEVHSERDHLLIEPAELRLAEGAGFYRIYTPFSRRWLELLSSDGVQARIDASLEKPGKLTLSWKGLLPKRGAFEDRLELFRERNSRQVTIPLPAAGSQAAMRCLEAFRAKLGRYATRRDLPAENGTSHIGVYLKNGSLTVAQALSVLGLNERPGRSSRSASTFVKELAWREFFYHVLWHCPRVEHEPFQVKYRKLRWENREDLFEAWADGRTGYPIVDAGMRQLKQTGWMHNRLRMITASFLTKDLLIDWRWGERHFMKHLLDGDLAPNNGGWQWAASTGSDSQPYFRVFNPTLQSRKFDPEGRYIRRWVPELAGLEGKEIHEPRKPVVEHAARKLEAIRRYKACAR